MQIGRWPSLCGNSLARSRRGGVSIYFLLAVPVIFLGVGLALYSSQLGRTYTDLQRSADASALAAAQTLVDDRTLMNDPRLILDLLEEAREEAVRYAAENDVYGKPLELRPNPNNLIEGDIVFGGVPSPTDREFIRADFEEGASDWMRWLNAVRITARQTKERGNAPRLNDGPLLSRTANDVSRSATAMLDRAVIGIRPIDAKPIPLAPIALLSDPTGETEESWEHQVDQRNGQDAWGYERKHRQCIPAPDGDRIHEMVVRLRIPAADGSEAAAAKDEESGQCRPNACLLQIGVSNFSQLCQQLVAGVVREQLAEYGGKFVLGADNTLVVLGSPLGPRPNSVEYALLLKSLQQLQLLGEPRVWPLFSRFDDDTEMPVVTGFVAARLAEVRSQDGDLLFVLQPCVLSLPGVLTDSSRAGAGVPPPANRYLCKVRLVE